MKMKTLSILALMGAMLAFTACEEPDYPDSIFNPDDPGKPTPIITSVNPPDETYGAIAQKKTVEITGQNFAATVPENLVYFGSALATVLEASPTRLLVEPPANFSDSLRVRIDARGAYLFGDYKNNDGSWHYYTLLSPVTRPGAYTKEHGDVTSLIDLDAEGNLYFVHSDKVDIVTPDGHKSTIGTVRTANAINNMRVGDFGVLYYAFAKNFIRTAIDTATNTMTHSQKRLDQNLKDLDFDNQKAAWIVAEKAIYRAPMDEIDAVKVYANDNINFQKVRYFENALYMIGDLSNADGSKTTNIYKFPTVLDADTLVGEPEILCNWTATQYGSRTITVLEMNADGKMFIGTRTLPLMTFDPVTGIGEVVYPKLLSKYKATRMTFGIDDHIFINTYTSEDPDNATILKVKLFENGAPYHRRG
ncbi:MAG TPA: hypothetical protein ENN84_02985 [Candidatus Marinimicrobia bacterium]|nr:hypothetical protein [Candidatus Neomarinimicrobiota bacterium]